MVELNPPQEKFWLLGETFIRRGRCSEKRICIVIWITILLACVALVVVFADRERHEIADSLVDIPRQSETNGPEDLVTYTSSFSSVENEQNLTYNKIKEALKKAEQDLEKLNELEATLRKNGEIVLPGMPSYFHNIMAGDVTKYLPTVMRGRLLEFATRNLKDSLSNNIKYRLNVSSDFEIFKIPLENCTANSLTCPTTKDALYRNLDGSCNNLKNPTWGMVGRVFNRLLPPSYADGISSLRKSSDGNLLPSPRLISSTLHAFPFKSTSRYSHLMMAWGQFLAHDISKAASAQLGDSQDAPLCCGDRSLVHPECSPISIPFHDPFYARFNQSCIAFVRSLQGPSSTCSLGPRQQLNLVTSFIDGSIIYGSSDEEMKQLRTFRNGTLTATMVRQQPYLSHDLKHCGTREDNFCYLSGDSRVNVQPLLISLHTLWMREHNRIAYALEMMNPHWSDEKIFQETRKLIGAMIQHISFNEFLPSVLGSQLMSEFNLHIQEEGFSNDYDDDVDSSVLNEFATAAFRFGHTMVQGLWEMKTPEESFQPLKNLYFRPQVLQNVKMMSFVEGALSQSSKHADHFLTPQLTSYLFKTIKTPFGLDLAAINIQRGRDHGLRPYNEWRVHCGLQALRSMDDLKEVMDEEVVDAFKLIYKDVDDIDLYSAGLSERPQNGSIVGPVFGCLIGKQFARLKRGDRYWYENEGQAHSFTLEQLHEIRQSSLARVICDNINEISKIQASSMLMVDERNPRIPCSSRNIPTMNLSKWAEVIARDQHAR